VLVSGHTDFGTMLAKDHAAANAKAQQVATDLDFIVSHQVSLEEAPEAYAMFRDKKQECIKVVLKPGESKRHARGNGAH